MSNNRKFKIPSVAITDNIVFSEKEVWAYYKVSTIPYDFLSNDAQASAANRTIVALSSLSQNASKKVDIHILMTATPFEVDNWKEQMYEIYEDWVEDMSQMTYFSSFLNSQARVLERAEFKKKVTYFGVKLFSRGTFNLEKFNILEFGMKEAWETLKKAISDVFRTISDEITDTERARAISNEQDVYSLIAGSSLAATRVTAEELLLLNKRLLHPAMPSPYLEVDHGNRVGLNDIALETSKEIVDERRHLKITQIIDGKEYTGYRATLSFSKFPEGMGAPSSVPPFMHHATRLGLPFTVNSRFTLIPTEEMRKHLANKELEAKDELDDLNRAGRGGSPGINAKMSELAQLEEELDESRHPWVSGSYRMTIESDTVEGLYSIIDKIKVAYSEEDFVLSHTTGDQLLLLLEEFPGGTLQVNSFTRRTNLAMIATSGFNYGGSIGDPVRGRSITRRRSE